MSPGGVLYSESPDSDSVSSCFVGMCYVHKQVLVDYWMLSFPMPWFNSVYGEIQLLLNSHLFSIFPAITYFVFSPKYFLSYQTEASGS